jgi:hypothetical protein
MLLSILSTSFLKASASLAILINYCSHSFRMLGCRELAVSAKGMERGGDRLLPGRLQGGDCPFEQPLEPPLERAPAVNIGGATAQANGLLFL